MTSYSATYYSAKDISCPEIIADNILSKDDSIDGFYDTIYGLCANRDWKDLNDDRLSAVIFIKGEHSGSGSAEAENHELMKRLCKYDMVLAKYGDITTFGDEEIEDYFYGRSWNRMFGLLMNDFDNVASLVRAAYSPEDIMEMIDANVDPTDWEYISYLLDQSLFAPSQIASMKQEYF